MPALVQRNTNFWLQCEFELDETSTGESEQLYSVKWYKNNEEFYRLLAASGAAPNSNARVASGASNPQQQQYFAQAGVNVLVSSVEARKINKIHRFSCERAVL